MPLDEPVVGQPGHVTNHHVALRTFYNFFENAVATLTEGKTFVLRAGALVAEQVQRIIKFGATTMPARSALTFGAGFNVTDDATGDRTLVDVVSTSTLTVVDETTPLPGSASELVVVGPTLTASGEGPTKTITSTAADTNDPRILQPHVVTWSTGGARAQVGIGKDAFIAPRAGNIVSSRISTDAPDGQSLIVDVNINGSTIYSNQADRLIVPVGGTYDEGGPSGNVAFAAGAKITVDFDQVGSNAEQTYRAASSTHTGTGVATSFATPLAMPAGSVAGDRVVVNVTLNAGVSPDPFVPAAGWVQMGSTIQDTNANIYEVAFTKVIAANEPAFTLSWTGSKAAVAIAFVVTGSKATTGWTDLNAVHPVQAISVVPEFTPDTELIVFEVFAYRILTGQAGQAILHSSFTELLADVQTTRDPALNANMGMAIGRRVYTEAGAPLSTAERTATFDNAGAAVSFRSIARLIAIRRVSPGENVTVQVEYL